MIFYSFHLADVRASAAHELARQTHDRVALLECDHSRLASQVDTRYAAAQEFEDFVTNKSDEDWIEITGTL